MWKKGWRVLSSILLKLFAVLLPSAFVVLFCLDMYYPSYRPHAPRPETGQTYHLFGTRPPTYGTAAEAALLETLFNVGFYSWGLFLAGWCIRVYILGEEGPPIKGAKRSGRLTRETRDDSK